MEKTIEELKDENARLRGTVWFAHDTCVEWLQLKGGLSVMMLNAPKFLDRIRRVTWDMLTTQHTVVEAVNVATEAQKML